MGEQASIESRVLLLERDVERLRKAVEGNGDSLEGRLRKEMDQIRSSYHDIKSELATLQASISSLNEQYLRHADEQERRDEQERLFLRQLNLQTALIIISLITSILLTLIRT